MSTRTHSATSVPLATRRDIVALISASALVVLLLVLGGNVAS
ncbi:MAG TPA: hypothetical protein VGM28_08560 [Candidatus Limnocylindrales bacterium]